MSEETDDPTPPPMDDPSKGGNPNSPPPINGGNDDPSAAPPPIDEFNAQAPTASFPGLGLGTMSEKDEKLWAMLSHLLVFAPVAISLIPGIQLGGIFVFVGPLVVWLMKREQSPFVDEHGKESLNQQILVAIVMMVGTVLTLVCIGFFVVLAAAVYDIVVVILATMKANEGKAYRYPLSYRFIK